MPTMPTFVLSRGADTRVANKSGTAGFAAKARQENDLGRANGRMNAT
jgi:hypothetical protein